MTRMLAAFVFALLAPAAGAVEILRWDRLPLAVPLVVGEERVVFVDRNVRVGVPAAIEGRLRVQSAAGALYLRANAPIEPTRLQVQDADTGAIILLDIAAEPAQAGQPPLEPVRILAADASGGRVADTAEDAAPMPAAPGTPVPVILTRYAAQSLYTPLRTIDPVPGITRVPLRSDLALDTLLPTLPVQSHALAAWRLDEAWVSAVRLRNTTPRWIILDPRMIQGDVATATFQHATLGPAGTPEDTTVVYLVTRGRGLAQALLPTIAPVDAALNLPLAPAGDDGAGHAQ